MMAQDEVQNYGYNTRDELISGQGLTYNYDDIGNRTTAEGKTYTANELNQYTAIDTFEPQYDDNGNQTLIKTSTGVWSVTYNAENRPVRWECGDIIVTINFECMDRRHCALQENAHLKFTILKQIYQNRFFAY
jgi:YD repeat-containing protein